MMKKLSTESIYNYLRLPELYDEIKAHSFTETGKSYIHNQLNSITISREYISQKNEAVNFIINDTFLESVLESYYSLIDLYLVKPGKIKHISHDEADATVHEILHVFDTIKDCLSASLKISTETKGKNFPSFLTNLFNKLGFEHEETRVL